MRCHAASLPALAVMLAVTLGVVSSLNADWPRWRGRAGNGVVSGGGAPRDGEAPRVAWKADVGKGSSSPIIAGNHLYTLGYEGNGKQGRDVLKCFDARTGKVLWQQRYECRYQGRVRTGDTRAYGGPSATPTFDAAARLIFTLSIDGDLQAWHADRQGERVWSLNLYDKYKTPQRPNVGGGRRDFGYTGSPLVIDDEVIVEVGAKAGTVIAFDRKTGAERWRSDLREPAGHTSGPVLMTWQDSDGKPSRAIVTLTLRELVVIGLDGGERGKTLARTPWQTDFACNIATPAVHGDRIIVTSAYNRKRTAMYQFAGGKLKEVWASRDHALLSSPLIADGKVFLINGSLICLDTSNGRQLWKGGKFGHGSCLYLAGDRRLLVFGKGSVALIDAGAKQYREVWRSPRLVRGTCYPHVAWGADVIACRDKEGHLVVLNAAGERQP